MSITQFLRPAITHVHLGLQDIWKYRQYLSESAANQLLFLKSEFSWSFESSGIGTVVNTENIDIDSHHTSGN